MSNLTFTPRITTTLRRAAGTATAIAPQFRLTIHTPNQTFAPGGSNDPTENLIGYTFSKQLYSNPLGQCTLYLNSGMQGGGSWVEAIPPMSLAVLQVKTPESKGWVTRFIGYCYQPTEDDSFTVDGQASRVTILPCQDLMYGIVNAILFIPGLLKQSISSAPDTTKTYGPTFQDLTRQIWNAELLASSINTNFIAEFFASLLGNQANQAGVNFFVAPSSLIWMLVSKLLPIYFNPVSNFRGSGNGGILGYTDLLTMALVPSQSFQYSQSVFQPNASFYQQIGAFTNAPLFEFFGDVRDESTILYEMTSDTFVTQATSGLASIAANQAVLKQTNETSGVIAGDPTLGGSANVLRGLNAGGQLGLSPDGGESVYTVMYRNTPFSPSSWNQLPLHNIHGSYTQSSRSRSAQGVVNYFQVQPQVIMQTLGAQLGQFVTAAQFMPGLVDNQSVLQYGLGTLTPSVSTLTNAGTTKAGGQSPLNYLLWAWYHHLPDFWQGTITVPGSPHVRIGQRIYIESWGIEAYVEGVQDSWQVTTEDGNPFQTQITFSRGMDSTLMQLVQQDYEAAYSAAGLS